jgi:hemolysin III
VFKLFYTGRFKLLSTGIYIAMGWLVVVAIKPLLESLDGWTLGWLLAGGLFYTLGTVFYHRESIRFSHAIWHMFVIAGSVCHYIAVTAQVLAPRLH